MRLCSTSLQ